MNFESKHVRQCFESGVSIWSEVEIKGGASQHITDLIYQFQAPSCLVPLERVWLVISSRKELMEINLNDMGV